MARPGVRLRRLWPPWRSACTCWQAPCCVTSTTGMPMRGGETVTIPNRLGVSATWWIADALAVGAGVLVCVAGLQGWINRWTLPLAVLPPLATLLLHLARPRHVRNQVDISFPVAVAVAVLLSRWSGDASGTPDPVLPAIEQQGNVAAMANENHHSHERGDDQRWCVACNHDVSRKILPTLRQLHQQRRSNRQ